MPPLGGRALVERPNSKVGTAGADFGAQLASPGPKANLASPTTVGECASQEPALAPSRDAVPGFGGFSSAEERIDEEDGITMRHGIRS